MLEAQEQLVQPDRDRGRKREADARDRENAAEFSFLMSMPIIAAAVFLEGPKALQQGGITNELISGVVASAVSGWLAISILMRYVSRHSYGIFAFYRVALGLVVLAVIYVRG